jgi:transposase
VKQPEPLTASMTQLLAIVESAKDKLPEHDVAMLMAALKTLDFLQAELQRKGVTVDYLKKMVFGPSSEKTQKVIGSQSAQPTTPGGEGRKEKKKRKGHGRNGAQAYSGATKVPVPHPTLKAGQACAGCQSGKLYPMRASPLVRITGCAPLMAKVYECEKLRCNACGEVATAPAPQGIGDEKYDEGATALVGLLKYGAGLPFNRLEMLQEGFGIPLPASTQWDLVANATEVLEPAFEELQRQAAQRDVVHNDDTHAKILELTQARMEVMNEDAPEMKGRTGVHTTGLVATNAAGDNPIALFFTGRQHSGENVADVLKQRLTTLPPPIQMCDASASNTANDIETLLAACLTHGRRNYVDVVDDFPEECRFVLEKLGAVYRNDAIAKEKALSPDKRLAFHQEASAPLMADLKAWAVEQRDTRAFEPNSGLGKAISYMLKYWERLTLFLRQAGAPLDNNISERALKKAILHRKNSSFYKTLNGAYTGDVFMSLIHTTELCGGNTFEYLVALLKNPEAVEAAPAEWMPWTYQATLRARAGPGPAAPP